MASFMKYKGWVDASGNHVIMRKTLATETGVIFGQSGYGLDFKVWGNTADDYLLWDNSISQLGIATKPTTWNGISLYVYSEPVVVDRGMRAGAVYIETYRDVAWTSNDGNPDCALKISAQNRSVSGTYSGVRGLDINARNRTGSCGVINGATITAENYNPSVSVVDVIGLEAHSKNNAVATGYVKAFRALDESGSSTGTHYGVEITTGDGAFMRAAAIQIDANVAAGAGWTNGISFNNDVTNVLDFANSDGTNGATIHEHGYTGSGAGAKLKIDVAGTSYYIIAYTTASDV